MAPLLRFRVKNFGSIRDEQTLSLVADGTKDGAEALLHVADRDLSIGRIAAIYGANASGKTMVLRAFEQLWSFVLFSQRLFDPTKGLPTNPFALSASPSRESELEVDLLLDGARYNYVVVFDAERFVYERLDVWPKHRKQTWFVREKDTFTPGKHLAGENRAIEKFVRPNSLFLSAAAQNNHAQLEPLFLWFSRALVRHGRIFSPAGPDITLDERLFQNLMNHKDQIASLLRAADTGISGLRLEELNASNHAGATGPIGGRVRQFNVYLKHRGSKNKELPFSTESSGTRTMFRLALDLAPILAAGGIGFVDELERDLHPALAHEIVSMFQDPQRNPAGAQLVFTTHNTTLLGNTLTPSALRRDQVWFTEKGADGATKLYPLTDFHARVGRTSNEAISKGVMTASLEWLASHSSMRSADGFVGPRERARKEEARHPRP